LEFEDDTLFQPDIPVWQHPDGDTTPVAIHLQKCQHLLRRIKYIAWRESHREESSTLLTWGHANCEAGMCSRLLLDAKYTDGLGRTSFKISQWLILMGI
jgi:hypothetical protein